MWRYNWIIMSYYSQMSKLCALNSMRTVSLRLFSGLACSHLRRSAVRSLSVARTVENSKRFVMDGPISYPPAKRDDSIVDDFHGTKINDPYRWLENPDSPETISFVESQNAITKPFLTSSNKWNMFRDKLTDIIDFPKFSCLYKHADYYFYFMNTGLQNHDVFYKQNSLTDEPSVFLDPNTLSEDGTTALSQLEFSDDGKFMAYGLSDSGSDWMKVKIRNVETCEDLPETLTRIKFTDISWTKDNKGFFYGRYTDQDGNGIETQKNENQKLYYHRIGESQEKDTLVAEFPDEPTWRIEPIVSNCGKYVILSIVKDCKNNLLFFAHLNVDEKPIDGKLALQQILFEFEADFEHVTNVGSIFLFRTNKNAPNYKLINIDFNKPTEADWTTLIAENATDVLDSCLCVNTDKLIVSYIRDVKKFLEIYSLSDGSLIRTLPIPIGNVINISGHIKYSEIFFKFVSFVTPGIIYRYDFANPDDAPTIFREAKTKLADVSVDKYAIEQVFYTGKDGVKVPMFIISLKSETKKPRPCLLYGYGGFNYSLLPQYHIIGLAFINIFNGVFAVANIRGGGEFGEKWHNSGRLLNKQNVFDDFQNAAEFLITEKYTSSEQLAIQGGSNGGLLVGACVNQRPELFGAAIAQVGVMDMLRFHKFTIGHAWTSDYGDPDEKIHFENLIKFSPLHNIRAPSTDKNQYPSLLILTGDHDDRVSPLHSLKFAAQLQHTVSSNKFQRNPVLLRVYDKAGHGGGKPTAKKIEEAADILSFLHKTLAFEK